MDIKQYITPVYWGTKFNEGSILHMVAFVCIGALPFIVAGVATKSILNHYVQSALEQTVQTAQPAVQTISSFPSRKILTISTKDYISSQGKELTDYVAVGVSGKNKYADGPMPSLQKVIPPKTEVVTDLRSDNNVLYGTALIPKR